MAAHLHDGLFKIAFGQPDIARGELEIVLPEPIRAQLDLSTLEVCPGSFVDEELRHSHADLLYAVRTRDGGQALVYVLFEHQSSFDARMPLRLLGYVVRIWERWVRDHPAATTLPIVLPLLLHQGPDAWQAAPMLASMLEGSPVLLDAVRSYVPHFRFLLDDLGALSVEDIAERTMGALGRLIQVGLWCSRSWERLWGRRSRTLLRAPFGLSLSALPGRRVGRTS